MANSYLEANRGFITSSKLKFFLSYGPEAYNLMYNLEKGKDNEDKRYFVVGNAFDTLVSYGSERFLSEYYIDEGLVVKELKEKLVEKGMDEKEVKGMKLPELRFYYYQNSNEDRVRLTPAEGRNIMGMYAEVMRQPLCDMGSDYMVQETIEAEYLGLPIRGTIDRLSLEKGLIRDWKTTGNFNYFEYNMDTTFDYVLSMAFYYVLVRVKHKKQCEVVLDVLGKADPYPYVGYKLNKERLFHAVQTRIKPGLEALIECQKTGIRESVYPIDYQTEGRYGDIISHKKGDPIKRMKLMQCEFYSDIDGGLAIDFVEPI